MLAVAGVVAGAAAFPLLLLWHLKAAAGSRMKKKLKKIHKTLKMNTCAMAMEMEMWHACMLQKSYLCMAMCVWQCV